MERPFRSWPPPAASRAFIRQRLHVRLAARFEHRVIVVQAGAGFGKTTLLSQALAENALDPRGRDVYLGCEPEDSSASTMLAALLHSIGVADSPAATIDDVCSAVWSAAPTDVCVVIDDAHVLTPGSAGEEVIATLVERLPANGHVVIASRRAVALSTSRLRALGRCDTVGEDDLRLDDRELSTLAERHEVDAGALAGLAGWPALAELTASAGGGVAATFVSEEVLSHLEPDAQEQFAVIVAIGGGDAETIAAACTAPVDIGRLSILPLVAIDESGAMRPHSLWDDLLRGRLSDEAIRAARRAAAGALRSRGAHVAAFELLAAAEDWDGALPALFDACTDQATPPWADVMDRWRDLVPRSFDAEPEVAYLRAMIERARDTWSPTVFDEFTRAYIGFRERGDIARDVSTVVRGCMVAMVRDDREWMVMARARGVELIAVGVPLQAIVLLNDVWRAFAEGRFAEVLTLTETELELEPRLRHFRGYYRVAAMLASGRADEAMPDAVDVAELGERVAPALATGWAMSAPSFTSLAMGDLDGFANATMADLGARFALSERVPHLAVRAIAAANSGALAEATAISRHVESLLPSPARRGLIDGFRALAAAAIAVADHDEPAAARHLAAILDDDLTPVGAGMAVRWYPVHAYLFHEPSREMLDAEPSGTSRQRLLDAARALIRSREGQPIGSEKLPVLDDMSAVVAAFGVNLAVELVVSVVGPGAQADRSVAELIRRAPEGTRRALRDLARSTEPNLARTAAMLLSRLAIPPPHIVRIELLGPPQLIRDAEVVDDANWRRGRVRQLVAALVLFRRVRRQRAGAMMWPDADEAAVSANLRMTLSYVQALLEPHRAKGDASWFVRQESGALVLSGGNHLTVDVWEFDDAIDAASEARRAAIPSVELERLLLAIDLWRGEPLVDLVDLDWAAPHIRRLEERYISGVIRAAELLAAAGEGGAAIETSERGLVTEPWCEALHRVIVSVHVAGGDLGAARRALARCDASMAEMGMARTSTLEALAARIDPR